MFVCPLAGENISPLALLLPCTSFQHSYLCKISFFFHLCLLLTSNASLLIWAAWSLLLPSHSVFKKEIVHTHAILISSLAILEGLSPYGDSVLHHAGQSTHGALSLWWQQLERPSVTSKGATDERGSHFSFFLRSISVFCGILTCLQCTS